MPSDVLDVTDGIINQFGIPGGKCRDIQPKL